MLALALVAGAALLLQRQAAVQLREEIALLRDEQRELAQLRAEHQRLVAAQVSEAELARLRADRTAVVQLRGEIERWKARTEEKAHALEQVAGPMLAAGEWRNAGRATPTATVETLLWAAANRDLDTFASMLSFDAQFRPPVDRFFQVLPEAVRTQYGTVERLIAQFLTKDLPLAAMRIVTENQTDSDHAALVVGLQNQAGLTKEIPVAMQRGKDGWGLAVPPQAVQKIANEIGSQLRAAR